MKFEKRDLLKQVTRDCKSLSSLSDHIVNNRKQYKTDGFAANGWLQKRLFQVDQPVFQITKTQIRHLESMSFDQVTTVYEDAVKQNDMGRMLTSIDRIVELADGD